jgi:hypothetical protein
MTVRKIQANGYSRKTVSTYQTKRRNIQKCSNLNIHCPQDLKSHTGQITDKEYRHFPEDGGRKFLRSREPRNVMYQKTIILILTAVSIYSLIEDFIPGKNICIFLSTEGAGSSENSVPTKVGLKL